MIVTQTQTKENTLFISKKKYIFFENAYPVLNSLSLDDINTIQQIEDYLSKHYPNIDQNVIGLRFSPTRAGCLNRIWLKDTIPSEVSDIYISFYLKKHPRIM